MPIHVEAIEAFFRAYGKALASGDASEIAACYGTPAMVLRDSGGSAVLSRNDLLEAFAELAETYRLAHLHQAVPAVTAVEQLGPELVSVDVDWTSLDLEGTPTGHHESYRYVLRQEHDDQCIHVVIAKDAGPDKDQGEGGQL
jgi:hypothetical protein